VLFGFGPVRDDFVQGRNPVGERCAQQADRPIAAKDDAIRPERIEAVIDNLIQIAHNVRVGAHTAMAACVGVAGGTRIGSHCAIGGAARIAGHLTIANHVTIFATAFVTKSIVQAGTYAGGVPSAPSREWARTVAHLRSLERLVERVRDLETRLPEAGKEKR